MNNKTQITDEDIAEAIASQGFVASTELTSAVAVRLKASLTGDLVYRTYNKLRVEKKKAARAAKKVSEPKE